MRELKADDTPWGIEANDTGEASWLLNGRWACALQGRRNVAHFPGELAHAQGVRPLCRPRFNRHTDGPEKSTDDTEQVLRSVHLIG